MFHVGGLNLRAGCSNLKMLLALIVLQQQRPNVTSKQSSICLKKRFPIYRDMSLSQVHYILKKHLKLKKINAKSESMDTSFAEK
jgi:hypothetical protein